MSTIVFVPRDATALSLGAESVARAIAQQAAQTGVDVQILRNGSRGLFWLEPLVEVATPNGRIAYGPVKSADVASLFQCGFLHGAAHPLRIGNLQEHSYFKNQERLTFERVGVI